MMVFREQLLTHADASDLTLCMLINLFDLLASCCEGENLFIESICQKVIGISELLKVVCNVNSLDIMTNLLVDFMYA